VRRLALALLIGALLIGVEAGCAAPDTPAPPADARVEVAHDPGGPPPRDAVERALTAAYGGPVPPGVVDRVTALLAERGASAAIEVPHEGHVHYDVLTWVAGARVLVFLERTGDGVAHLQAFPVPAPAAAAAQATGPGQAHD
jgi:hypothetical protein